LTFKVEEAQPTYRSGAQMEDGSKCSNSRETTLSMREEKFLMLLVATTLKTKTLLYGTSITR
jgi:hypothetical protein